MIMEDYINLIKFISLGGGQEKIELFKEEKWGIEKSRKILDKLLRKNPKKLYYGINTGVGALFNRPIPQKDWSKFQENLIISHACGVGNPLEKEIVRGMMLHMILNLKKGYSAIRLETLELLIKMFNRNLIPYVPEKGSVGASGDLVPQAHIALALIGKGNIWYGLKRDKEVSTATVFGAEKLKPVRLQAGEAIALLNGTSLMTSCLAWAVFYAKNLIETADIAAALTMAALDFNFQSFDERLQKLKLHFGQQISAAHISNVLSRSNAIFKGENNLLQDAYSLRCAPQVHGTLIESILRAWKTVEVEINSFTGNPVIIDNEILQGSGNFHGQPLAQVADELSIALTNLSAISERRVERLLNPQLSGLPAFLAEKEGINSGLMVAQYTAAALVAENKVLAAPASIHSIPVSANQEDFVSMGAFATQKLLEICKNTAYVLAIELLCAVQALDLRGNLPESNVKKIHKIIRIYVPRLKRDRILAKDIETIFNLLHSYGSELQEGNEFLSKVQEATGIYFFDSVPPGGN